MTSFLGFADCFRKFILGFSTLVSPLTALTGSDVKWDWCFKCQQAFDKLVEILCNAPLLQLPDFEVPFVLTSDASLVGTGAVLTQKDLPIAYTSSKFIPAERGYTTTEQELLGVIRALQEWRCYLEGGQHPVKLVTDHNPLIYLRSQPNSSRRQARWVEYLERFHYEWQYIPGRLNVADPLSRIPPLLMSLLATDLFPEPNPPTQHILSMIQMGYAEDVWFLKLLTLLSLLLTSKASIV